MATGGDNRFIYSAVVFAVGVLFLMPVLFNMFVDGGAEGADDRTAELLAGYENFTGSTTAITNEEIWTLTSITTPYVGGPYHYSADGWLYGSMIGADTPYRPAQYADSVYGSSYVQYDADRGAYYYTGDTYDGHSAGDLYTAVSMDTNHKSNLFFTSDGKHTANGYFYYEFDGYRYSFSPVSDYNTFDSNGDLVPVTTSSSLSLIWYSYYDGLAEGIAGQLILTTDRGTAYLTSNEIITAFDGANNTSKFNMNFNGVNMNVYIRISPYYSQFMSIGECWAAGYWEIMITSNSADASTYTGADYSFNVYEIWNTFIDLFTFNTAKYGIDGPMGTVCSLVMCVPMYALLISIGLSCYPVLILAGIVAGIQAVCTAICNWDLGGWL